MMNTIDGNLLTLRKLLQDTVFEIEEKHWTSDEVHTYKYMGLRKGMYSLIHDITIVLIEEQLRLLRDKATLSKIDKTKIEAITRALHELQKGS